MADIFVKTFECDYVYLGDVNWAETVFAQLPHWLDDHNEHAPDEGLKLPAPVSKGRHCRRAFINKGNAYVCPVLRARFTAFTSFVR